MNKYFWGGVVFCFLINLTLLPLSAVSQEYSEQTILSINFSEQPWIISPSSPVLEEREAKLTPDENAIGSSLKPLLNNGDYQEAIELMELAQNEGATFSPALQHIFGQTYLALGDNKKAQQALLAALTEMPNFARAHQLLGLIYLQQKNYQQARNHLSKSISLGIITADTYAQLAFVNLQDFSAWSAISGYQQALLLDAGNQQWQQGLLFALVQAKHFTAAQALIDEMLSKDANNKELWLHSSNIALNNMQPAAALTRLEIAIQLGETEPANQMLAAQLHLQHGSSNRAIELMVASIDQSSQYFATVEEAVAWLIYNQQWQQAQKLIAAGLATWSNLSSVNESKLLAHQGAIALAQSEIDVAMLHLNSAIELDPTNGEAMLSLADAHTEQQAYVQAALLYVRAEAIDPYQERALLKHAQLALDQQDYQQGLRLLRRVLEENPNRDDIMQNIQTLERLILNQS